MIENKEQLIQAREALKNVEDALFSLKEKVYSENPALFEAMSEDYINMINEMQYEINEYIGINKILDEKAQLWIRVEGDRINLWNTPSSIWSQILAKLRNSVNSVAKNLIDFDSEKLRNAVIEICKLDFDRKEIPNSVIKYRWDNILNKAFGDLGIIE